MNFLLNSLTLEGSEYRLTLCSKWGKNRAIREHEGKKYRFFPKCFPSIWAIPVECVKGFDRGDMRGALKADWEVQGRLPGGRR